MLQYYYKYSKTVAPNNLYNRALKVKGPSSVVAKPYLEYFGKSNHPYYEISLFFSIIILMIVSCDRKPKTMESPLSTVIKLNSAEAIGDFRTAKKYINIAKVFRDTVNKISPDQAWQEKVNFENNLRSSKKFTNIIIML